LKWGENRLANGAGMRMRARKDNSAEWMKVLQHCQRLLERKTLVLAQTIG
jgi:hypothetical protein